MNNGMGSLGLGDILKNVMENPDMLKNAMEIAGKLKDNPEFKNIFSGMQGQNGNTTERPVPQNGTTQNNIHNNNTTPQPKSNPLDNIFVHGSHSAGDQHHHLHDPQDSHGSHDAHDAHDSHGTPESSITTDVKKYTPTSSDRVKLLNALKPYLSDERREKIDFILKILSLIDLAQGLGLKNLI